MDYKNERFSKQIDAIVKTLITDIGEQIDEIWLFGSLAKGTAKLTSDIDIMVSMKESVPDRTTRFMLYDKICNNKISVDLRFCVAGNVNTFSKTFNKEVLNSKVVLWNGQ